LSPNPSFPQDSHLLRQDLDVRALSSLGSEKTLGAPSN
jgi:hypothetical protein